MGKDNTMVAATFILPSKLKRTMEYAAICFPDMTQSAIAAEAINAWLESKHIELPKYQGPKSAH